MWNLHAHFQLFMEIHYTIICFDRKACHRQRLRTKTLKPLRRIDLNNFLMDFTCTGGTTMAKISTTAPKMASSGNNENKSSNEYICKLSHCFCMQQLVQFFYSTWRLPAQNKTAAMSNQSLSRHRFHSIFEISHHCHWETIQELAHAISRSSSRTDCMLFWLADW